MARDIHNVSRSMVRLTENIRNDPEISNDNKEKLLDFLQYEKARGQKDTSIRKDLFGIRYTAQKLKGVAFDKATKKDFVSVMATLNDEKLSERTKASVKVSTKKFVKWVYGMDRKGKYPENVDWIVTTVKKSRSVMPEDLITKKEFDKLVENADNDRDKALLFVLFETGARIQEALSIKVKHIIFNDDNTAWLMLDGKTGMRRIPIVACVEPIRELLKGHPTPEDREAYIFLTKKNMISGTKTVVNSKGKKVNKAVYVPLSYAGARKAIDGTAERAGVKKKVNPHIFRYTSGSDKAKYMPEHLTMKYHGWNDPNTARGYSRLSPQDLMDSVKKHYGLDEKQAKQDKAEELIVLLVEALSKKDPSIKAEFVKLAKKKGYYDTLK